MRRRAFRLVLAASLFMLASCRKEVLWQTDFDGALKDAADRGRNVFVLFSGEDWDGRTQVFRSEVLDTERFRDFVKDGYVLLNVDLTEVERAEIQPGDDAGGETSNASVALVRRYGVSSYPSIYVLSKEGYVLSIIQYNEGIVSPSVLEEVLEEQAEGIAGVAEAIARVQSSSGVEKVRAIDALYEATPEAGRRLLAPLVREVPSLDPADGSGLVGKYEFIRAYDEAVENVSEGRHEGVVESFVAIAENGHLAPAQKLEAYYNAAYLMALFGESDYDRMYELLQKAMEADPENVRNEDVSNLLLMVSKFRDIMGQDEGFSPGAGVNGGPVHAD